MYIPIIRKIVDNRSVFVERALPTPGTITVQPGSSVEPFTEVGWCKVSHSKYELPEGFKPTPKKGLTRFYYAGSKLGRLGAKNISAPFNGSLVRGEDKYVLYEEESRYALLAGVWGVVNKVVENHSVLFQTSVRDILMVSSTPIASWGELVVFPNPSELLLPHYLEKYTKSAFGKIIYVGFCVSETLLSSAVSLGVKAVVAGSAPKSAFLYAKSVGLGLGVFEGFGRMETPPKVFDALNNVSGRLVFFEGDRNTLRIPMPPTQEENEGSARRSFALVKPEPGTVVQVLQNPYFGQIGTVDSTAESGIFVKFQKAQKPVEVKVPNVFVYDTF